MSRTLKEGEKSEPVRKQPRKAPTRRQGKKWGISTCEVPHLWWGAKRGLPPHLPIWGEPGGGRGEENFAFER